MHVRYIKRYEICKDKRLSFEYMVNLDCSFNHWIRSRAQKSLLSPFLQSMGYSMVGVGFILSLKGIPRALMNFISGWLTDEYGRKLNFVLGILLGSIGSSFLISIAWNGDIVALALILSSVAASWQMVPAIALLIDTAHSEFRGTVIGIDLACIWFGMSMSSVVSAILAAWWGFRAPFFIASIMSLMILFIVALKLKEPRAEQHMEKGVRSKSSWKATLPFVRSSAMLSICYGALVSHFVTEGLITAMLPLIILNTKIGGLVETGMIVSAFLLCFALGQLIGGYSSDKVGRKPCLIAGFAISAFAFSFCSMMNSYWLLFILITLAGFGLGISYAVMETLAGDLSPPMLRGMIVGFWRDLGDFIGPTMLSIGATLGGITAPFYIAAILLSIGFAFFSFSTLRQKII